MRGNTQRTNSNQPQTPHIEYTLHNVPDSLAQIYLQTFTVREEWRHFALQLYGKYTTKNQGRQAICDCGHLHK